MTRHATRSPDGLENLSLSQKPDFDLALNPDTSEIRLVSILPGEWTEEIKCELNRWSLDSRPRYEALSYAWGDPNDTRPIIVDGCSVQITANLESALRRLRHPNARRTLWVDAVCIDQSDLKERNHQLVLMRDIFQNCEKALIWFGEVPGSNTSKISKGELAEQSYVPTPKELRWARVLKRLCNEDLSVANRSHDLSGGSYYSTTLTFISLCQLRLLAANKHLQELEAFAEGLYKDGKAHSRSIMKALNAFAFNAWFDRIWVIQEYVVSPAATIHYGPIVVSVTMLVKASQNWVVHTQRCCNMANSVRTKFSSLASFSNKFCGLADTRREWLGEVERNLWELCISFRDKLASQDIDKVYSLLGIVRNWEGLEPLRPDYHLSAADVYRQVALDTLRSTKSLLPLQFNLDKKHWPQLPSWVIDWSTSDIAMDRNHYAQIYLYNATINRRLKSIPVSDPSVLGLYGIKVDRIAVVAQLSIKTYHNNIQIYKQWHLLAGLHENPGRPYSSTCTWHEAYWRTLCADTVFQSSDATDQLGIRRALPDDAEAYACWCMNDLSSPFQPGGLTSEEQAPMRSYPGFDALGETLNSNALGFGIAVHTSTVRRRLFLTKRGYLGLGRADTRVGDEVVLLVGGYTPFIVRKAPSSVFRDAIPADVLYTLIGDCYVHGIMDGEGMELGIKEEPVYLI